MGEIDGSVTLEPTDLNDTDEGIIRMLAEGRCSPRYLARELDQQQPYINQRLKRFTEHGHVRRVDRGLYEIVDSPLADVDADERSGVDLPADVVDALTDQARPGESPADVVRRLLGTEHPPETRGDSEGAESAESVRELLGGWNPGRDRNERERKKAAVVDAAEWLAERGHPAKAGDFKAEVYDENPHANENSWWTTWIRPGLQHLADQGVVEIDGRTYAWNGGNQ